MLHISDKCALMVPISSHVIGRATTLLNSILVLVEMSGNFTVVHLH